MNYASDCPTIEHQTVVNEKAGVIEIKTKMLQ